MRENHFRLGGDIFFKKAIGEGWLLIPIIMLLGYVHDWNPVIVNLFGPIALRWYGLSYLFSFLIAIALLKYLTRRKLWVLSEKDISDFIAMSAIFGVFMGGRLGYVLFYMIPNVGWASIMQDPLSVIRVWDGGMASHGGIFALVIFTFYYAKKKQVSWTGLGDGLCVVAPVGIFLVRVANFINGELYGRVDKESRFGVKFPDTVFDPRTPEYHNYSEVALAVHRVTPLTAGEGLTSDGLKSALREHPSLHASLEEVLLPRHPSQLYEGLLEGGLLFAILWTLRVSFPKLGNGVLTGLFFIIYACGRIFVEQYREPDSAMIGVFTKGQFYSLFMIVLGIGFLVWGITRKKYNASAIS